MRKKKISLKKILATGALCGCAMAMPFGLAGCSMSADQKEALDLVTEKADDIIDLLETNMDYSNKKLSKEDAAEKIFVAKKRAENAFLYYDNCEISFNHTPYSGLLDYEDGYSSGNGIIKTRKNGDKKTIAVFNKDGLYTITHSDFAVNKHFLYQDGIWAEREYSSADFVSFLALLKQYPDVVAEDVCSIEQTSIGYKFDTYIVTENEYVLADEILTYYVTFNGDLVSMDYVSVSKSKVSGNVSSQKMKISVKYGDIDYSVVDSKLAELINS